MAKYPARLRILQHHGSHTAYFATVEDGSKVLDDLAERLAKIREFSNRDEEPVFRFRGAGALYAIDLRKVIGASLEMADEWADVSREAVLHDLVIRKTTRRDAEEAGLTDELERAERQFSALKDAAKPV